MWALRGRTHAAQALHADVDAVAAKGGYDAGRGRLGARKCQPQHVGQRVQPLRARARPGGQIGLEHSSMSASTSSHCPPACDPGGRQRTSIKDMGRIRLGTWGAGG